MAVLTIDFEASCLPKHGRSFPIEVGVAGTGIERSWIIQPHADWQGWDWTAEAEALHGLDRARIAREGKPADIVFAELVDTVAGARLVADSRIDQYWLDTLATAARRPCPFVIDHVATLLDEYGADEARIAAAVAFADARHPDRHRAIADARWLFALIDHVSGVPTVPMVAPAAGAAMSVPQYG
ncbi:MAG: hypothetical protein AB7E60_07485 [Sphingobium sp.]